MSKQSSYILDRYIIRKFLGTFFVAIILIIGIVIIFDISEKIDDFVDKQAPLKAIVVDYYANFIPYFMNMFSPLFVFISVIFITSKLAANSEIIAILAGGVSFKRLLLPYSLSAGVIAIISLGLNLFVIPPANQNRLAFEDQYIKSKKAKSLRNIHYQLEPNVFVYMETFSVWNNTGNKFTLETFEDNELRSKLSAASAKWNNGTKKWDLKNYYLRTYRDSIETVTHGEQLDTLLALTLEDLNRASNVVEQYNYFELNDYINTLRLRGDRTIRTALIQKHTRFAMPFSAFILTIMGVALSSRKRRGGIGLNIGLGIGLSFSYILFLRFAEMFVHADVLPPSIALWTPNILFTLIAIVLYRLAPK